VLIDSNGLIGKTLGSFTLQRLIGRGGMGSVYLARQIRPRRTVAVKVLMPAMHMEQSHRTEFLARFRREADAIAALDHINIMPIYEYGEQEDVAYLVMPYVTGGTLRDVIEKRGILPLNEVVRIIEQAAAALDSAHAQNIVHRDLKPGNMLFHGDGRLLLADFGLAKVLKDDADENSKKQTELTSVGTIVGTPEYLSPEQGTGKDLDYRTDVYSLGVVLYHLLAGRVPFTGSTAVAIALKHALEMPPPLQNFNADITPEVEAVVNKALAKLPADRYSSAGELSLALKAAVKDLPIQDTTENAVQQTELQQADPAKKADPHTPEAQTPDIGIEEFLTRKDPENVKQTSPIILHQPVEPGLHTERTEVTPPLLMTQLAAKTPDTHHTHEQDRSVQKLQATAQTAQLLPEQRVQGKKRGLQPVAMMLLGALLTLVIIVGGFEAYSQFSLKKPTPAVLAHTRSTPTATIKITPISKAVILPLPPAMIGNAGALLYGTNQPGTNCDTRGGTWSSTSNAQISCAQGTTLRNNDQTILAGSFLEKLPPGKTMPSDYVLQVQITVNAGSNGDFGVFVRDQPGEKQQATYAILLAPPSTWRAYEYQNNAGSPRALVSGIPTQVQLTGTFTIDVLVQGDTYTLFINGGQQGNVQSGVYPTGNIGLAADAGANITFKNLEVYALK
jgi:serine/threonine protein kinase